MLCALGLWFAVFIQSALTTQATEMSKRVASTVSLTRTALRHAHGTELSELLTELSEHESLDVEIRLPSDTITALPREQYWQRIASEVRAQLGADTIIAWEVNRSPAFWVSFDDASQRYWLAFERQKLTHTHPMQWASWLGGALLLCLLGAFILARYLNRPLSSLAKFAYSLATNQTPVPLPESGAREIVLVNASFNHMAGVISQFEQERELMLAGLSHDLRTPLTRLRLEIEMSPVTEQTRARIDLDLAQIDQSMNKLSEYARAENLSHAHLTTSQINDSTLAHDISHIVESIVQQARMPIVSAGGQLSTQIMPNIYARIEAFTLQRIISNLLENATRYGCNASGVPIISLTLKRDAREIHLEISDTGPGIAPADVAAMTRPFSRGDLARTGAVGSGLGLAIVDRLAKQAHGQLALLVNDGGGLLARVSFQASR